MMTLNDLKIGQSALVEGISSDGSSVQEGFRIRLEAMGLTNSKLLRVIRAAAFGGPLQVRVGSTTEIAIRRSEAKLIKINLQS